jgi:hypothetical protein
MTGRWSVLVIGTLLAAPQSSALAAPVDVVRDFAAKVGPIVGEASTCQDIAQRRVQAIVDQFREVRQMKTGMDSALNRANEAGGNDSSILRVVYNRDTLENMNRVGLGAQLGFGRRDHQAAHKTWGAAVKETGTDQPIELE